MKTTITILTLLLSINFASALVNTTNFHSQGTVNIGAHKLTYY